MRRNWLNSHLSTGASRLNNGLERCNLRVKENFAENVLLPANEFANAFVYGTRASLAVSPT